MLVALMLITASALELSGNLIEWASALQLSGNLIWAL